MKSWREAAGVPERRRLLEEAYQAAKGNRSEMAALLGLTREHVSRLLSGRFHHVAHGGHADHGDHSVIPDHAVTRLGPDRGDSSVTTTSIGSLTSGDAGPRLADMTEAAEATPSRTDRGRLISLRFSSAHRAWMKTRALEKALREGGRESVSAVLAELIEREMDREKVTDTPARAPKAGGRRQ